MRLRCSSRIFWLAGACSTAIGTSICSTQAAPSNTSPALEVYGRLPYLEDVALSPDGSKLAFVRTSGDERSLFIVPVLAGKTMGGARVGMTKLRGVDWLDEDDLLVIVSGTSAPPMGLTGVTREWFQLLTYNLPKGKMQRVDFAVEGQRTMDVVAGAIAVRELAGKTMLFAPGYAVGSRVLPALFSISIPEHRTRIVAQGTSESAAWLVGDDGRPAAEFEYQDDKKVWQIRAANSGSMTEVATGQAAIDVPEILGFDNTGQNIIVRFAENGNPVWKPFNLRDRVWEPLLGRGTAFYKIVRDRKTGRILGGSRDADDQSYSFFDNEIQAHWNAVLREFPNERVTLESFSDDFSRVIVKVFGGKHGYSYVLYDWYTHHATTLGNVYLGVDEPAEVRRINYLAGDGLSIPGFLTLPRGLTEKNLPLIVLPHGGPAANETERFDWWAQAFANQGYAVLQPNYRGSSLSQEFVEKGYGEWGRKMQSDLSDGVRYLAGEGIVDPTRVCIVGASYGGYAALAGVTLQSGIYRCAISVAGVADLKNMRAWTQHTRPEQTQRYWDRYWGASQKDGKLLDAISPIAHVDAVKVPVLLIHGKDDTVVPFEQSDLMLAALKRAGKSVDMVTLKHEDHWLSSGTTRLQMLQASVEFLRVNNPPN